MHTFKKSQYDTDGSGKIEFAEEGRQSRNYEWGQGTQRMCSVYFYPFYFSYIFTPSLSFAAWCLTRWAMKRLVKYRAEMSADCSQYRMRRWSNWHSELWIKTEVAKSLQLSSNTWWLTSVQHIIICAHFPLISEWIKFSEFFFSLITITENYCDIYSGEPLTEEEATWLIKAADKNNDGCLDFHELLKVMIGK